MTKYWKTIIEATKQHLQQKKFTKFKHLKYKYQTIKNQTPERTQVNFEKPYENTVKGNTGIINEKFHHLRKPSKRNIQEQPPTFWKKLEFLHPAHKQHHYGKSSTRVALSTKQTSTNRVKKNERSKELN